MSAICIIDTSVFCNILAIPNKSEHKDEVFETLQLYIGNDATLLLPMTTIYETGNHIGQNGDGRIRRQKAQLFVERVQEAFEGEAPWSPTPMDKSNEILNWLSDFPDWAMGGSGFGDLSILQIYKRQCELHPSRDVFIWSYDEHLSTYSRPAIEIGRPSTASWR